MADHDPDLLNEAATAVRDLLKRFTALTPPAFPGAPVTIGATEHDLARAVLDVVAAQTPPSETEKEVNPLLAEVAWRDRHLAIGREQLAAANAEFERLHREVGAVAGIVRDDRVRAALQNALGDRSVQEVLRDIRNVAAPPRETGRCGEVLYAPSGTPEHCRLPHGHDGWHHSDHGTDWTAIIPDNDQAGPESGLAEAIREALGADETPGMLRAMLLDAADRLNNPRHRGNAHAWPKHAEMLRQLAERVQP